MANCSCGLKLGSYPISAPADNGEFVETLEDEQINFLGPGGQTLKVQIKKKIQEIRDQLVKYYSDEDKEIIALPNHRIIPKKVQIFEEGKHDKFFDDNCEQLFHQQIVSAARKLKLKAFAILGFNLQDCLR